MLRDMSGSEWFLTFVALTLAIGAGWFAGTRRRARRERSPVPAPAAPSATASAAGASAGLALQTLGRYRIERELGRGAMGVVYLGRDPQADRPVALKTMALSHEFEGAELTEARACFFGEAEMARRLSHPDIVRTLESGEDHGLAFIAMEYVDGHDLQRHGLAESLLPVPLVLRTLARAAQALAHAHRQGVVHRDVKPANVLVNFAAGVVKLTDFGVAHVTDASRTRTGLVLGTPCYMSPEQMVGDRVDGRADLYSLGVVLFQLLTGSLPHRAASMGLLMHQIANEVAPDVRSLCPHLPASLAQVVARAVEKRVELRFADGDGFAAALSAVAAELDAAPDPAGPAARQFSTARPPESLGEAGFERPDPRHNARH